MKCKNHPEEDVVAVCQKFGVGYCRKCCTVGEEGTRCQCTSPNVHCKFRQECLIHYMEKAR